MNSDGTDDLVGRDSPAASSPAAATASGIFFGLHLLGGCRDTHGKVTCTTKHNQKQYHVVDTTMKLQLLKTICARTKAVVANNLLTLPVSLCVLYLQLSAVYASPVEIVQGILCITNVFKRAQVKTR